MIVYIYEKWRSKKRSRVVTCEGSLRVRGQAFDPAFCVRQRGALGVGDVGNDTFEARVGLRETSNGLLSFESFHSVCPEPVLVSDLSSF